MIALNNRLEWDLSQQKPGKYDAFWLNRRSNLLPSDLFQHPNIWLEIGSGTGGFFIQLSRHHPDTLLIAIERARMRAKRLLYRSARAAADNLHSFRGNAIAALIRDVPANSIEKIFILYPCPFPKTSQRFNRWYLHPIMPHLHRALKPMGALVWASDQEFYINEASYVCEMKLGMKVLKLGSISPHPLNHVEQFPFGRTKFEAGFLGAGQICYELIVRKQSVPD